MTVPLHPARMVWLVRVFAWYRLTRYPVTACPLDSVLAVQLTVTARPATVAVGVAPWLTLAAAAAPLPPTTEPTLQ